MFKRILNHKDFWKGVLLLSLLALVVFNLLFWAISGFDSSYFKFTPRKIAGMVIASLIYGCIVTYGKFWTRYAKEEHRKNEL